MSVYSDKIELFALKNELLRSYKEFSLDEIGVEDFFRRLFVRDGVLQLQEAGSEHYYDKHYNAIVMSLRENERGRKVGKNFVITQDLDLSNQFWSGDMVITSPVTYVGRNRTAKNARLCYGIAIDLDGVAEKQMRDVLHQQNIGYIPNANLIVNSGNGLHLYFLFEKPIALFDESKKLLGKLKHALTETCWNMYTSNIKDKQYQGIFQGFRLPGTLTKFGKRVCCFARSLDSVPLYTIKELNKFSNVGMSLTDEEEDFLSRAFYIPNKLSLKEAKEKYPDWYERRIVRGEKRGRWHIKRDLYDWWLYTLRTNNSVKEGHRYFCVMSLAMYALKCNVSYEELKEDAYSLIDYLDWKTNSEDNHFTAEDVEDALKAYKESYVTFPRYTISKITGVLILPNKRNYRKQELHIKMMNVIRDNVTHPDGDWRKGNGRPKGSVVSAEDSPHAKIVREWRDSNPESQNKALCARETGLSRPTVHKWWETE